MKKSILFVFAALFAASTMAQTSDSGLRVWENNVVTYQAPVDNIDSITFVSKSEIGETLIGDLITNITPIIEDEVEVGYTMSFLHHDPIKIYHGKKGDKGDKGEQGDSMFESVTQDEDSVYFTLANGSVISLQKTPNKPKDFEQTIIDNLVNYLTLSSSIDTIEIGETLTLTASTLPFNNSKVSWSSSNEIVATVDNGNIKGLSIGIVKITATAGNKTASSMVYVKPTQAIEYSVSSTQKVQFAKTNTLWYEDGLRFATNAYDRASEKNSSTNTHYNIHLTNFSNDIKGKNIDGWRVLNSTEWDYLLSKRKNAITKITYAKVNNCEGVIILPDNWVQPTCIEELTIGYNFEENTYSKEDWEVLQLSGATFLVAGGHTSGSYYLPYISGGIEEWGFYYIDDSVIINKYTYNEICITQNGFMYSGYNNQYAAVRLVKDVE